MITTGSPDRRRPLAVLSAIAVAASIGLSTPGFGQTGTTDRVGPPVRLLPQPGANRGPQPPAPEVQTLPAPAVERGVPATTPGAGNATTVAPAPADVETAVPQGIEVGALGAMDPSSIGLLDSPTDGSLGVGMWTGTPRTVIEQLLPKLPMATGSAVMHDLARRLLLTSAAVPSGTTSGPSLLAIRIERLAAGGMLSEVNQLLRLASPKLNDPALARARMNGLLLSGDNAGACDVARGMIEADADAIWQKVVAFCLALNGETARVELYAQLLRELGHEDAAFYSLLSALTNQPASPVDSLPSPLPLHLAMLRAARQAIPEDAVGEAEPMVLRAIATSPNATTELRLAAAERAAVQHALPVDALRQIYLGLRFTPEDRANALARAEQLPGPRSNALLLQVAQIESQPMGRATTIDAAQTAGGKSGQAELAARVYLPLLQDLEPTVELSWFASAAGRAAAAAGDMATAFAWLDSAQRHASLENEDAVRAVIALWPLVQVGDSERRLPYSDDVRQNWWKALQAWEAPERFALAQRYYTLLQALNYPLPEMAWEALYDGPLREAAPVATPALRFALSRASTEGRVGETVLLALLALGPGGPDRAGAVTLGDVVSALSNVGLSADAHAVAREAMLAARR